MAGKPSLKGLPKELLTAITILFLLSLFIVILVPVQIIVPGYRLTTGFRVAYNIITTGVATVIARFAAGEIQTQWLHYINHEISEVQYQVRGNPGIAAKWRAVLGIAPFMERIKHIRATGLAELSIISTALITTAIVSGITLTDTTCESVVFPPRIHSGADNECTRSVANSSIERLSPLWEYRTFWNRDDGSAYFATTNLGCPSWSGSSNMLSINTINPEKFAYARNGVAVKNSAIGVPEIFYTDFPKLVEPLELPYGHLIIESNLRTVSHCLPVMARNPIQCRAGGNVTFHSEPGKNNISVDAGGCKFDQPDFEDPAGPFGIMVSRLCPTQNAVGQANIAIGATGIISLTLAAAIGDTDFLTKNANKYDGIRNGSVKDLTYAVSCSVDVKPTIQWRTVTLELEQGNLTTAPSYSKVVAGEEGCSAPMNSSATWNLGDGYAAGAVAALVPPLSEGRYWNGMTNTIFNIAVKVSETSDRYDTVESWDKLVRKAPFGFAESNNALEDVLGLTTGITMSQMSTLNSMSPNSPLLDPRNFSSPVVGNATFACTRVGSGNMSALLFTIPPLFAMAFAIYLLCVVPRQSTKWETSRLDDLIAIGMASEREKNMAYTDDHKRKSGGEALGALSLGALRNAAVNTDGRDSLVMNAASPGWGERWITDASGTRAVRVPDEKEIESWTAGVPSSPARARHEGHHPTDGVK
ncbi:hypothetical protein P280DRAFT_511153 [Massarina eburnea CBS 473.64]|uniref:Uncharacterized protein n=1 Tax=Massarina eburnea CBS 473.64 TaxID=1395130 RepID=A0A6A6RK38_9PLEO|nr:hypothetical protein P280DRAFT_511153 [Massarina eburnea CBS 473.64]